DTPSAYENRRTDAHASGLGLKMAIPTGAFLMSGQLEYSRTHSSTRNGCGNWLTFQITFRY
ncbi:MAG TPA: hypothetical protein VK165_04665, partial [Azonexus sp.]|nr:hypothetical protein [Azonexus sp.]